MSDQNTISKRPFITLADLFHCDPYIHEPDPNVGEDAPYIIYALQERETGRHYVGLTSRTLTQRVTAHLSQAKRDKPVRNGGLMAALRQVQAAKEKFADRFDARVVARAYDVTTACALERRWIHMMVAHKPQGFNDLPGGSSVEGPDNARPLAVETKPGTRQIYRSIHHAIADRNRYLRARCQPLLQPSTVYARLAQQWSPEEALGYQPHSDGRARRPVFQLDGVPYSSLRAAAETSGMPIPTLRSRLHRAKQRREIIDEVIEIGTDRRSCRLAASCVSLAWPGTGEWLTAEAYAARTGVAKATLMHRWHRIRRRMQHRFELLSPAALYQRLTTGTDRRNVLRLMLPDGRVWTGGERDLVRRVLDEPGLEAARPCRLSESGIRRRLRTLTLHERNDAKLVAEAFGFAPAHAACGEA